MIKPPIIVTGCQRSGTAIVTEILAKKYDIPRLGDRDLRDLDRFNLLYHNNLKAFIVQMPTALQCFLELHYSYPDVHFVGVQRDEEQIIASMKRIQWRMDDFYHWPDYLHDIVAYMKGQWDLLKRLVPESSWTEVEYDSFKDDPLFIEKELRKDFTVNQTQLAKPIGPVSWRKNDKNV